jgi:hypothetical protein
MTQKTNKPNNLQKLKYITTGIIIGATVVATPSIASEIKEFLLYKADYKIVVNGKPYVSDELPILNYKGVTYTPLKAIGTLLNSDVQWNAEIGQVEIGKKVVEKVETTPINSNQSTEKNEKPTNQFLLGVQQSKEISQYLENNFSNLKTTVGNTKFSFSTSKNVENPRKEYDFFINTKFDIDFFNSIKNYPKEMQNTIKSELKNHQEKLAKSIIAMYPDEKFIGGCYHITPSEPMLNIMSETKRYFTWTNYNPEQNPSLRHYANTKASEFRWYTTLDNEF